MTADVGQDTTDGAWVRYLDALLGMDRRAARQVVDALIGEGWSVPDLYLKVFQPALREVGLRWQRGVVSVAQEHFVTEDTVRTMARLSADALPASGNGRTVVTCGVEREAHGVGLRMVSDFFEMAGWLAYHLGSNVPGYALAASITTIRPDVVALSITMSDGIGIAQEMIAAARGLIDPDPVFIIGGSALGDRQTALRLTGADAFAPNAREAVVVATALVDARG